MGGGGFIHLVVSFVSTDNKREGSRKLGGAALFCSTARWAVNNAATGALAGATGFAAVPAAQSATAEAWFCFAQ